jgi:hypothetical protein
VNEAFDRLLSLLEEKRLLLENFSSKGALSLLTGESYYWCELLVSDFGDLLGLTLTGGAELYLLKLYIFKGVFYKSIILHG